MTTADYLTHLDISIVAGRRPGLLKETLTSFTENVFRNFLIGKVYVNIDLIFGDGSDERDTLAVVQQFFPTAEIRCPDAPSFGAAVKWLWGRLGERLAFHLEDDWIALEPIAPPDLAALLEPDTFALAPTSKSLPPPRRAPPPPHRGATPTHVMLPMTHRIWGPFRRKSWFYAMGTAPKFIDGQLARDISALMNPDLDPEKQMSRQFNPQIFDLLQQRRCAYLLPRTQPYLIEDIGRAWRDARLIKKTVQAGKSVWSVDGKPL